MPGRHSPGEKFRPSASEFNRFGAAADWVDRQRRGEFSPVQRAQHHSGVIWVRFDAGEGPVAPRYAAVKLIEPLILPEDENTIIEFENRLVFRAEPLTEDEEWWNFYNHYIHIGIIQEPTSGDTEKLVPCVVDGWSRYKVEDGSDSDEEGANHKPTSVWPRGSSANYIGLTLGGGPLQLIWMSAETVDDVNGDYNWAVVRVGGDMDEATFVEGTLNESVGNGQQAEMTLDTPIGSVTVVGVQFPYFHAEEGDLIGAVWKAQHDHYVAIAKVCPP